MKLFYLITIAAMLFSCTTLFKANDHRVIKAGGKSAPVYANKNSSAWLDLRLKADDDPINDILAMGRWHIASRKIKARLTAKPGDEQLLTMLASALFMERKYRSARFYANKVLQVNTNSSAAKNILGLCTLYAARNSNDFRIATNIFKQAFASSSKEIASGLNLGFLYLRNKNAFFAEETFQKVIDRCYDCQAAYLGLGIAQYQQSKFAKAVETFEYGLDIDKSDEIMLHLGLVYRYGMKSLSKARAKFSRVARNYSAPRYLRNKARAEMAIIDEKQMYRYQQKYNPKTGDKFTDTYLMPNADQDFGMRELKK